MIIYDESKEFNGDSDSLVGLAIQFQKKTKPLLEKAGGGQPPGQMRFTKKLVREDDD